MTYDWEGRRNRLVKITRMMTGAVLLLVVLGLPLLVLV
jgi:hypothetical protein